MSESSAGVIRKDVAMASLPMQSLARRFHACGLKPEEYMPLVKLIDRWTRNSGEEWTVKRLKDFRQLYLHRYAGLPYSPETRIALASAGVPKGPFGLFSKLIKGKRGFAKTWNALMVHTGFVSAKVTSTQASKFLAGVRRDEPRAEALRSAMDLVSLGLVPETHRVPKPPPPKGEDILDFVPREGKERHTLDWVRTSEYRSLLYEAEKLLKAVGAFRDFPDVALGTLNSVMRPRDRHNLFNWEGAPRPVIGHVSAVQEPGFKARFIASPHPPVQQMMRPLHNWLAKVNQELQGNWQFDQTAGLGWVRDALRTYGYAYSVDLSSATDHFPLKLQTLALRVLGADEQWVSAVETFSHAMWEVRGELRETFTKVLGLHNPLYWIRWTVGQPLGLIFSFNLFSLTHWALCYGIQLDELGPGQPLFAIVGDDVVWFSQDCAKRYMTVLDDLDCPYSVSKSLESDRLAEFLSRIVEPDRIVPSYKWKAPSDDSFIDIARCLGPRSLRLFKPRQRSVLKAISELPEPYGLGWNPQGIPYWERLAKVPDEPLSLKEFRPVSASHHLSKIFYTEERLKGYLEDLNIVFQARDDQSLDQVLLRVFGRIGLSEVLRDSLCRDFLSLSSLCDDEFRKFGLLRPEAIKLLPTELIASLGVDAHPVSVQAARLASLVNQFRRSARIYAETPERQSTLERYERSLLRSSIVARGRESNLSSLDGVEE